MYEKNPSVRNRRYHCLQAYTRRSETRHYFRRDLNLCAGQPPLLDSIQILNIDSTNIQPSHWLAVSKAIEEHYEEYDGFVITHGTDTMAYTAAALSYLIQNSPKPIVITGAQKPIDMENTPVPIWLTVFALLPMTRLTG